MNDADAAQIIRVSDAAQRGISVLSLRGYERLDTPLVEETELFLRKSGGELSSRLYHFVEPGGFRTSLRPEFTSPVIRHAIERGEAGTRTCRYQYFGPVFRYASPDHPDGQKTRQFNQLGAELIGPAGPQADGEIIATVCEIAAALGIAPVTIALGHVGLLRALLKKFQLSERSIQFLLAQARRIGAGELDAVRENAARLGLTGTENRQNSGTPGTIEQIKQVLDRSLGPLGANAGSRTREEVIARLARKQTYTDDAGKFESALKLLADLIGIDGTPSAALSDGRKLAAESNLDVGCFDLLERVVESAVEQGVDEDVISLRYGLARGVAYYTGMLFDVLPSPDATESLGGGGRYDGLTRALGLDADVPALGFAFYLDAVIDLMSDGSAATAGKKPVLVVPADASARSAAARAAAELRSKGTPAVLDYGDAADRTRFSEIITVDASGVKSGGAK